MPRSLAFLVALACLAAFGAPRVAHAQSCPVAELHYVNQTETFPGPAAGGSRNTTGFASCSFFFSEYGDSVRLSVGYGSYATFVVRGRYALFGPATGTPVSARVATTMSGRLRSMSGDYWCEGSTASLSVVCNAEVGFSESGSWVATYNPWLEGCAGGGSKTVTRDIQHTAGEWFEVTEQLYVHAVSEFSFASTEGSRRFEQVQPGTFVVRCDGDTVTSVLGVGPSAASGLGIDAIWPNPARGSFRAAVFVPAGSPATARLMDLAGRTVDTRVWEATTPARRELAFAPGLPAGVYFLQVKQGLSTAVRQVVIRP